MRRALLMGLGLVAVTGAMTGLAACQKKTEAAAGPGNAKPAAAPADVGMPHRKAGLWAQTIHVSGMTQTTKICLDGDTDAKMALWGQQMKDDTSCRRQTTHVIPGGVAFESECDMGEAGRVTARGTATGDFNSSYVVKVTSTTSGSAMPKADGAHEMQIDAEYQGACPANMKGGDVALEIPGTGGKTVNLEDMQKLAEKYRQHAGK